MPEKDVHDVTFRTRVPRASVIGKTAAFIKDGTRHEERQRVQLAISAFWSAHAYEQSEELTEVALQSILDLSEQILQIALLANLPVEQLNFKSQVLALIQKTKTQVKAEALIAPPAAEVTVAETKSKVVEAEIPSAQENGAAIEAVVPKARRTMFQDK